MFFHYLKSSCRTLLHYRMQSLISIGGLSVGLLCFVLCLYISRYIVSIDQEFPNHKRLTEIILKDENSRSFSGTPAFVASNLDHLRLQGIDAYTTVTYSDMRNLAFETAPDKYVPFQVETMEIDSCFTDLFSRPFVFGNRQSAFVHPNAVILTRSMSQKVFGDDNPVGKQLLSYGPDEQSGGENDDGAVKATYVITGVVEDLPENTSLSYKHRVEALFYGDSRGLLTNREVQESRTGCNTYALMQTGVLLDDLNAQIEEKEISIRLFGNNLKPVFTPIGRDYLEYSPYIILAWVLVGIGVLVLLTALLNFYVFTIGQFYNRLQEFSIRKSVGGGRRHLFFLLFTQIGIMLLIALFIALCFVEWLCPDNEISLGFQRYPLQDGTILWQTVQYLAGLVVLSALICAYVAGRVDRMNVQSAIKGGNRRYIRNTILGLQLFICLLFVGGSVALQMQTDLMVKGMYSNLSSAEKESVFVVPVDFPQMKEHRETLLQRFRQNSSIADVLETGNSLFASFRTGCSRSAENYRDEQVETQIIYAGSNFADFMHVAVCEGTKPVRPDQVLVNRKLAQYIDSVSAVGKPMFRYGGQTFYISGVIDPLLTDNRFSVSNQFILQPDQVSFYYVKALPGHEKEVRTFLYRSVREFLPETIPYEVVSFRKALSVEQKIENDMRNIITFLGVVCLVITLLGIYSAITLDTERRQKEVAIRKINGARTGVLIWMFGRFYLVLLSVAAALAFPLLWLVLDQWLRSYTVSIAYGPLFFGSLLVLTALFIGLTIVSRIVRIVRLNPAIVIKNE